MWFPRKTTRMPARRSRACEVCVKSGSSGYHVSLILTLTINPAIDRIITADRLVFEDRGYILNRDEAAGGRGINAAHVIHSFGGKTTAILAAGGATGKRLETLLGRAGFPIEVIHVKAESRANLTISDKHGLTIKLNELGAPLEPADLAEIKKRVEARYKIPFTYTDDVVQLVVSRCTENESGGRMIDAILTNTVLPRMSEEFLSKMMSGTPIKSVGLSVENGDFAYTFE